MLEKMEMNKCAKLWLFALYIAGWVLGILALILPFWVSTEIDGDTKEVEINKKIDSGLWWKYERFEAKEDSLPKSDDWWRQIAGTSLHTRSVDSVAGLLVTGLVLLTAGFISSVCLLCCCCCNSKRQMMTALVVDACMLFLAAVLIAVAVIIYFTQVLKEYDMSGNEEHLGASFWLAAASSIVTFLNGVYSSYQVCNVQRTS